MINKFSDALNDEQVKHRNMIVEVEHPDGLEMVLLLGNVFLPSGKTPVKDVLIQMRNHYSSPPHLGTNTREILKNWSKYQDDEIDKRNIGQNIKMMKSLEKKNYPINRLGYIYPKHMQLKL